MITDESEIAKICALITGHTPKLGTTADAVAWLVARSKAADKALSELESIRTDKLASKGLSAEASSVSRARVILGQNANCGASADYDSETK